MQDNSFQTMRMPMIALRGLVVFPGMLLTFDVERPASVAALAQAGKGEQLIFLAAQKDLAVDIPKEEDIYSVGTVCRLRQQLRQPHGGICRVMVEGLYRAVSVSVETEGKGYTAELRALPDHPERVAEARMQALLRNCVTLYDEYLHMNQDLPSEQMLNLLSDPRPDHVAFFIAQNMQLPVEEKQGVLENVYPSRRLLLLGKILNHELNVLSIEKELNEETQEAMNRGQREYYLREQMKIIQSELGDEGSIDDVDEYRRKIEDMEASDEVKQKLRKELSRLAKQPFGSSEAAVLRGYLDVCLEIPWGVKTEETVDIAKARRILDEDHFGLDKVKERILEYLAVRQLSPDIKGGLLCFVGPPGTGKTSIAQSMPKAATCSSSASSVPTKASTSSWRRWPTSACAMPMSV